MDSLEQENNANLQKLTEKCFEDFLRKTGADYRLRDVLKHPVKYSKGVFSVVDEMSLDLGSLIKTVVDTPEPVSKKILKTSYLIGGFYIGDFITTGPHELLHALGHLLSGNTVTKIAILPSHGGYLYHRILPLITTNPIEGAAGSVTVISESLISGGIGLLSPYFVLTPLAVYAIQEGKTTKQTALCGAGFGILFTHVSSVIGDFFFLGTRLVNKTYETIKKEPLYKEREKASTSDQTTLWAALVAGFLLGNRIMGYMYRLSKGLVNSVRHKYKK